MPFFGNIFSLKKTPPRKSESLSSLHTLDRSQREAELGPESGPLVINVGGHTLTFEDGQWIAETGGNVSSKELQRLKKRNIQLEDENNLLKLKIEVLVDMLTETTVEFHQMEKEVEVVKTQHHRKK